MHNKVRLYASSGRASRATSGAGQLNRGFLADRHWLRRYVSTGFKL